MSNKTSDKNVANIEEMNFKRELLQRPISYLTEENLDKLETHCLKAIRYEVGIEHKVVLELLERHKEYLAEREQDKKRIKELEEENYVQKIQIYENYIPKQDVIDKIEEIIMDKGNRYYYKFLEIRDIQYTIDILREILGEEK